MKKSLILGAIAAIGLAPFELKKKENGDFSYRSMLLGVKRTKDENGESVVELKFFNCPKKPDYSFEKKECCCDDADTACDADCECEGECECTCTEEDTAAADEQ